MALKKDNAGIDAAVDEPTKTAVRSNNNASDPTVGFYVEVPKSLRTRLRLEAIQKEMTLREIVIEKLSV